MNKIGLLNQGDKLILEVGCFYFLQTYKLKGVVLDVKWNNYIQDYIYKFKTHDQIIFISDLKIINIYKYE